MLKSYGWVVAHEILVTAQRPNSPFPLDLTWTWTGTWPGACQYCLEYISSLS